MSSATGAAGLPVNLLTCVLGRDYTPPNETEVGSCLDRIRQKLGTPAAIAETDLAVARYTVNHLSHQQEEIRKTLKEIQAEVQKAFAATQGESSEHVSKLAKIFIPQESPAIVFVNADEAEITSNWTFIPPLPQNVQTTAELCAQAASAPMLQQPPAPLSPCPAMPSLPAPEEPLPPNIQKIIASFEAYLPRPSAADEEEYAGIQASDSQLKAKQLLLLHTFGHALFTHYLQDLFPWIVDVCLSLTTDLDLMTRILDMVSPGTVPTSASPPIIIKRQLPAQLMEPLLQNLITCNLQALAQTFEGMTQTEALREECGKYFTSLLSDSVPRQWEAPLRFFFAYYAVDMLLEMIRSLQEWLKKEEARAFYAQLLEAIQKGMEGQGAMSAFELLRFLLINRMKPPLEAGFKALLKRLQQEELRQKLFAVLRDPFAEVFFPEPQNLAPVHKSTLVSLLENVFAFFRSLNGSLAQAALAKIPDKEKNPFLVRCMYQQLFTNDIADIPSQAKEDNVVEKILQAQIKDIVKALLGKDTDPENNVVPIICGAFAGKILNACVSSRSLAVLIEIMLQDPPKFYNPFDRLMPGVDKFDASDVEFSRQVDILVKGIIQEAVRSSSDNTWMHSALKTLLSWIPDIGMKTQQALNKTLNSGSSLIGVILLTELLFRSPPPATPPLVKGLNPLQQKLIYDKFAQDRILNKLKRGERACELGMLLRQSPDEIRKYLDTVDAHILGSMDTPLIKLLETKLPYGTRSLVLGHIQRLYCLSRHDLFVKIFLIYCLNGVKVGIKKKAE